MNPGPKRILFFICLLLCTTSAAAQLYPTQYRPNVQWQQLSTDHFKIVFPQGEDSAAYTTAHILETEYPRVQKLTGGALSDFPVILTNYNDRSNGLVTPLHFRSEIDIPPILGKSMNPQTGDWLQNVVPHELVHALQFSNTGGPGLAQFINPFSPDLARAFHGAAPAGIAEGLAVYYESESVTHGGGRGNYPFFINQFSSIFDSPYRWSMGQMVHFPTDTRPFRRHYIGGYTFTQWLHNTYGDQTSRDAIEFHVRWPFLGYGVALKHATGQWPSQLYDQFIEDSQQASPIKTAGLTSANILPISLNGAEIRRPRWLTDSTLVFHGSFYNANPGFYRYDLASQSLSKIDETTITFDYRYALANGGQSLVYSYYQPDAIFPNAYKAQLVELNSSTGSTQPFAATKRLFSPTISADSLIYALRTHHAYSQLVKLSRDDADSVQILYSNPDRQLVAVKADPAGNSLAVIMNQQGTQGLWLADTNHLEQDLSGEPDVAFENGSVFDPVWHPRSDRILFSADFSGTLQVYEYDVKSGRITQWTNAPYNAFEASYSPNGNRIAYVVQQGNERLPAIRSRNEINDEILTNLYSPTALAENLPPHPDWEQQPYHAGLSWLKPRSVLPVFDEISGSDHYRWGAGLHSSSLMQQQAYVAKVSTAEDRLWYDLTYHNKRFFPGFKLHVFNEPAFRTFHFNPEYGTSFTQRFLRQERSLGVSVPMPITLEQNVDFTSLFIEPQIRLSQLRYMTEDGDNPTDYAGVAIGNIFAQFNYKLEQNIRDVQPGSGFYFYGELEHYFKSASVTLPMANGSQAVDFAQPTALRGGMFTYLSPWARWNQSLRLGLEGITQTHPLFDIESLFTENFAGPAFPTARNLLRFSTRYTVPLWYPDNGGLLVPLYLSNVYLVGFSDTVTDPTARNILDTSRTVLGGGLRLRFRISNLALDIGVGIGVEPSRSKIHYFIGDF